MRRRGRGEGGLTKRSDHRWQASFTGSDGRRHYLYGVTRREAAEKLHAALLDKAMHWLVGRAFSDKDRVWAPHRSKDSIYAFQRDRVSDDVSNGEKAA